MDKHSPIPWKIAEHIEQTSKVYIRDINNALVLACCETNALLVVEACSHYEALKESHGELLEALKAWRLFWDKMPKGQLGKLSVPIGELNDAFVKMDSAIPKAEAVQ